MYLVKIIVEITIVLNKKIVQTNLVKTVFKNKITKINKYQIHSLIQIK